MAKKSEISARMSEGFSKNILKIPKNARIEESQINLGNISEGIFAAAICSRFFTRKKRLSSADVINIINKLSNPKIITGKKSVYSELNLKASNKNSKIKDDLKLRIELSSANMDYLKDYKNNSKSLLPYINSSIRYANSTAVMNWSKMVYENNRYDKIEVLAKGTTSGKTTKVDVETKITNDQNQLVVVDLVSLKAGDVKQFGQRYGILFENQKEFFNNLFDINISKLENEYNNFVIEKKDVVSGISLVYTEITKKLKSLLSKEETSKKIFEKLGNGIKYYATLNEDNVKMVHLNLNEARLYDLNKLDDLLSKYKYKIDYGTYGKPGENLPILKIKEIETGKTLLTIRCKKETDSKGKVKYRNYLEKEELFTDFLSSQI
jgi:hypothetical protein